MKFDVAKSSGWFFFIICMLMFIYLGTMVAYGANVSWARCGSQGVGLCFRPTSANPDDSDIIVVKSECVACFDPDVGGVDTTAVVSLLRCLDDGTNQKCVDGWTSAGTQFGDNYPCLFNVPAGIYQVRVDTNPAAATEPEFRMWPMNGKDRL